MIEDIIVQKYNGILELTLARGKANTITVPLSREIGNLMQRFL